MKRLIKLAVWAFACSVGLAQAGELTLSTTGYTGSIVFDDPAQPTKTLTAATSASGVVSTIPEATIEVSPATTYHYGHHGLALLSPNGTDAAEIDLSAGGTLTIDADLTDLEFDTSEACVSGDWAEGVSAATFLPASPTNFHEGETITYWKNRSLSAIKAFRATVVDESGAQALVARSLYFANDNTTASVQFSFRRNPTWLYSCKVEFCQVGADITARVCWIHAIRDAADEAVSGEGVTDMPQYVYDGERSTGGIGIRAIEAGELGTTGGKGIAVRAGIGEMGNDSIPYGAANKVLLWKNLSLDELEGVQADVTRIGTYRCLGRLLEATATTKTFVFQHYYDNYIAGAKVVFEQDGPCVYAYVSNGGSTSASYSRTNPVEIYPDRTIPYDGGYSGSNAHISKVVPLTKGRLTVNGQIQLAGSLDLGLSTVNIGSAALTEMSMPVTGFGGLCFSREAGRQGFRATQAAVNDFQGIAKFDGCRADFDSSFKLGDGVCLILANGATVAAGYRNLWADMSTSKNYGLGYQVSSGSTFVCAASSFRTDKHVLNASYTRVDDATIDWKADQGYYLGHLCLRNGSKLTGNAFRFGNMSPMVIVSEDESSKTNVISAVMRLYQSTLDGAMGYVCRSGTLKITADVNRFKDGASYSLRILKLGLGTLLYDCKNTSTTQHEVVEGTFRLAKNEAYNDESLLFLRSGARVELAPNVSTAARRLIVTNSTAEATSTQTLALESGAALTLPEDGLEFQNGGTLRIEGEFDPKAVRVGTTNCLTDEQLAAIRWVKNDRPCRVVQDEEGYLCQPGFLLIFR